MKNHYDFIALNINDYFSLVQRLNRLSSLKIIFCNIFNKLSKYIENIIIHNAR